MIERVAGGPVEGLLLDMDGVLTVSWKPIDGAVETLSLLRRNSVPVRVMTNTTSHSRAALSDQLHGAGFDVAPEEILTAPVATASYLRAHHPGARVYLLGETGVAQDLEGVTLVEREPADVVVVGGADEAFTFHNLNAAFRMLLNGAALVAMHRNFSWLTDEGLCLDAGAYVMGLEAATGLTAAVTGRIVIALFLRYLRHAGRARRHGRRRPGQRRPGGAGPGDDGGADAHRQVSPRGSGPLRRPARPRRGFHRGRTGPAGAGLTDPAPGRRVGA